MHDDELIEIIQNQADPLLRRVAFKCYDSRDGRTPVTGLTWSGSQLREASNFVESDFTGSVQEIMGGWYLYQFATLFLTTLGSLSVRPNRAGVQSIVTMVAAVVGSPGVNPTTTEGVHSGPHVGFLIGL